MHEQWLRSMESNHAQLVEDLGRVEQHLANHQKVFADHMVTVALNQAAFAGSLARLTEEHIKMEAEHLKTQQEMRELRELIERYIRFRGNGNSPGN